MAVYYKPQSPIQSGEDFIYPITTADQVKVDKDTRLNAVGVYLKNIDNSTDTTVYGNNATTLGGVAAEDYALKTDTAPNSSKLGGKAPEYYIQPRNLLDNSDFRNPVNQRGNGDVNTKGDYPIDRWIYDENGTGCSAGYDANYKYLYIVNNATDGSWAALYHNVPSEKLNTGTYTICFHEKLIAPISMLAIADDTVTVLESATYEPDENGLIIAQFTISSRPSNKLLIAVYATQGITVAFDWAALYEGSYTADTLPPYVPKGYAAELAECQRYFYSLTSYWKYVSAGICTSTTECKIPIRLPQAMRIMPTVTIADSSLVKIKAGSVAIQVPSAVSWINATRIYDVIYMECTITGATDGDIAMLYFGNGGRIDFSADL